MLALDLIGLIPVIGALKYSDEVGTLFKNAGKVSVVAEGADGVGAVTRHADEAGAWLQGVKVFRYSDETAEAVASGEKLLKESQTVYESFADMMSPEDAKRYLDFLENGSREGLTGAELAGVEKADALLVSRKVEYEDVWDLRNAGDLLESGSGNKPYTNSRPSYGKNQVNEVWENAKDPITGKVYDPSGVEITWDKTKSRNGQWDMGHIPGEKYSEMHQLYMDDVISKDEFLEWYRNPKNYRPELPSTNRSHKYE